MSDDAKRLSPTKTTIRELFGKCGNQCAFPTCKHEIINAEGVFVAEICHIEAAESGGPRFNPEKTNQQRRHVSNLMLMCHKHHKITDNIDKYPIRVLKDMKRTHEAKYLDAANKIWESIEDHTDRDEISSPSTLARFFGVDGVPGDEREAVKRAFHALAAMLKPVPIPSREILLHSVRRGSQPEYHDRSMRVITEEVAQACGLPRADLWNGVQILVRHKLVQLNDDYPGMYIMSHVGDRDDWNIWWALRSYCEKNELDLRQILVLLRFNLLD